MEGKYNKGYESDWTDTKNVSTYLYLVLLDSKFSGKIAKINKFTKKENER